MVERFESSGLPDEIVGTVTKVELTDGVEGRKQYHIEIAPVGVEIKGPTGVLHEWIPLSPRATEERVPQGSVMDRYLTQIEICLGSVAKKAATVGAEIGLMKGKKFKFSRIKLGRDFDGHPAKEYLVPVALA